MKDACVARTGKIEQHAVRLLRAWPPPDSSDACLVFCPFLAGLDPVTAFWIGALGWHDANASLLAALAPEKLPKQRLSAKKNQRVYAGVFCVDPFGREEDIFAALRTAGIDGIVNLPSVSFFDGELGGILDSFDLGKKFEIEFLLRARARGLRIAGCVADIHAADALVDAGADLLIAHGGAPQPNQPDPGQATAAHLRRRYPDGPPVISASELLLSLSSPHFSH